MPKYSGVTFTVQTVENRGRVSGYVVSGFLSKKQLVALRSMVDGPEYQRSAKWRGEYQELAKTIVGAVDESLKK